MAAAASAQLRVFRADGWQQQPPHSYVFRARYPHQSKALLTTERFALLARRVMSGPTSPTSPVENRHVTDMLGVEEGGVLTRRHSRHLVLSEPAGSLEPAEHVLLLESPLQTTSILRAESSARLRGETAINSRFTSALPFTYIDTPSTGGEHKTSMLVIYDTMFPHDAAYARNKARLP